MNSKEPTREKNKHGKDDNVAFGYVKRSLVDYALEKVDQIESSLITRSRGRLGKSTRKLLRKIKRLMGWIEI